MDSSTSFKQKPLIVESQQARREFTQCQNCYKCKTKHKVKLSLCAGCQIATYCSAACQKAHWPAHKTMCLHRRTQQQSLREFDRKATQGTPTASASSPTAPSVLPSEVHGELRSFTKKFNPALFQAAFNCLHLATHPVTAQETVVWVVLTRIPASALVPGASTKAWARFKLKYIGPVPVEFITEHLGQGETFLEMKAEQEKQHISSGFLGTITICISTSCPGGPMLHNVSSMGFGDYSKDALKIEDTWKETFEQTVEKMCGRSTEEDAGSTESTDTTALVRV